MRVFSQKEVDNQFLIAGKKLLTLQNKQKLAKSFQKCKYFLTTIIFMEEIHMQQNNFSLKLPLFLNVFVGVNIARAQVT